jgi:hypothetical protein
VAVVVQPEAQAASVAQVRSEVREVSAVQMAAQVPSAMPAALLEVTQRASSTRRKQLHSSRLFRERLARAVSAALEEQARSAVSEARTSPAAQVMQEDW